MLYEITVEIYFNKDQMLNVFQQITYVFFMFYKIILKFSHTLKIVLNYFMDCPFIAGKIDDE